MNRQMLILKIVQALNDSGALDVNHYLNGFEQCQDAHDIIETVR